MNEFHNQSVSEADTDDLLSGVEPLENMTFSSFHSSPPHTSPRTNLDGSGRGVTMKYSTFNEIAGTDRSNSDALYPQSSMSIPPSYLSHINFNNLQSYESKEIKSLPVTPFEEYKDFSKEVNKRYAASVDQMKSVLPDSRMHQSTHTRENLLSRFNDSLRQEDHDKMFANIESHKVDEPMHSQQQEKVEIDPDRTSPRSFADSILKSAYNSNMSATELEEHAIKNSPPRSNKKSPEKKRSEPIEEKSDEIESDAMSDNEFYNKPLLDQKPHTRSLTIEFEHNSQKSRSPRTHHTRSLTTGVRREKSPKSDYQIGYKSQDSRSPKTRHARSSTSGVGVEKSPNSDYALGRRAVSDIGQLHVTSRDEEFMPNRYSYKSSSVYQKGDSARAQFMSNQEFVESSMYGERRREGRQTSVTNNYDRERRETHRDHKSPPSYSRHMIDQGYDQKPKEKFRSADCIDDMLTVRENLQSMLTSSSRGTHLTGDKVQAVSPPRLNQPKHDDSFDSISTLIEGHLKGLQGISQTTELGGMTKAGSMPSGLSKIDNTLFGENTTLRESLEKERTRRKHCERNIQALQSKLLESQQQLAVAVSTEKKKDVMIEQLDKTLAKVVDGWKKREGEREQLTAKVEEEKRAIEEKFHMEIAEMQQQMDNIEDKLAQEKQRAHHAVEAKDAEIKLHETERDRLSELVETERERVKRIESDRDRASKGKEHVARQLEALQKTLDEERNTWQDREREYTNMLDEARTNQHQLVAREKDKLDEQQRLNRDVQDALNTAKTEMQHLQLEVESVSRERDHIKMECGLMEARIENTRQKLEAEIRADFEKQTSQKLAESQKQMTEYESDIRENHRHQINELTQKHADEVRSVQDHWRTLLQQKESVFSEKVDLFEERLKESRTEITQLKVDKQKLEVQRNDITKRLQSMMQTHCNEALSLLVGAKEKAVDSASSMTSANTTLISGIEPLANGAETYVEKYLQSHRQPNLVSQPQSHHKFSAGHFPANNHSLPTPSSSSTVVNRYGTSNSQTNIASTNHMREPQPFSLPPNIDYRTSFNTNYQAQTLPPSGHGISVKPTRTYTAAPSVDQSGGSYSVYSGSGSSESMVTARQGMSSSDVNRMAKTVSSSTEMTDYYVTPAASQHDLLQSGKYSQFSSQPTTQGVRNVPISSAYQGLTNHNAAGESSGYDTHVTSGRQLFPSNSATHVVGSDANIHNGYHSMGYNEHRHTEKVEKPSGVEKKDEDDNISVISSLLNEPLKLDYTQMSDRLNTFEDRQKELQHYIKKLLDKSPGDVKTQDPVQAPAPAQAPPSAQRSHYQAGHGVVNRGLMFTPPVKQRARPDMPVTNDLPRTVSEPPSSFMPSSSHLHRHQNPPLSSVDGRPPPAANLNTSGLSGIWPSSSTVETGSQRSQAPSFDELMMKPKAFNKSTVQDPVNTRQSSTRIQPAGSTSMNIPPQEPSTSTDQALDMKSLLSAFGNPGIENLPRVEDLMAYLQSIQASQGQAGHQPSTRSQPQQDGNVPITVPARLTNKAHSTKVHSPQSVKSSPPTSSRKSPRHGPVTKVKVTGSQVKDKKPLSARGKALPVWK